MAPPDELTVLHTADLGREQLAGVRALLEESFGDDLDDEDVRHCLGGLHVLATLDGRLTGHAALVQRDVVAGGRVLRAGYVEGVVVAPGERRRGVGGALTAVVEDLAARAHEAVFLSASDEGALLYRGRGWRVWTGPTGVMTPDGVRATPDDDGGVHVHDPLGAFDVTSRLLCGWRAGDVW